MNSKEIEDKIALLPPENDKFFAFETRKILDILEKDEGFDSVLKNMITDTSLSKEVRFNAWYLLLAYYWRVREYKLYRDLVDQYETEFLNSRYLAAFKCQYYLTEPSEHHARLALDKAKEAIQALPDSPNVLHLLADAVVRLADVAKSPLEHKELVEGERAINRAIAIKGDYARYYATKAELVARLGNFEEARKLVQKAIEIEPSSQRYYELRIANYETIKLKILLLEKSEQFQKEYKRSIESLHDISFRSIELLGLLAAIIAFLMTNLGFQKELKFDEAARLAIISGLMILFVFSTYSIIFTRPKKFNVLVALLSFFSLIALSNISLSSVFEKWWNPSIGSSCVSNDNTEKTPDTSKEVRLKVEQSNQSTNVDRPHKVK